MGSIIRINLNSGFITLFFGDMASQNISFILNFGFNSC
jgi:hypothetical protein